jgi:GTP-binding protein HflX
VLMVYNKIDLLARAPGIDRDAQGNPIAVWLSAVTGDGLGLLLEAIAERIGNTRVHGLIRLPPEQGRLRARFYALGQVVAEHSNEAGELVLEVDLLHRDLDRLYQKEGLSAPIEPMAAAPQA